MKRLISVILILALCLSGCDFGRDRMKEPVSFYYLREHSGSDDYDVFFTEGAIGAETREAAGHRNDLNYLLALYLQGPMDAQFESPFPVGSKIEDIQNENGELTIVMNTISSRFNDMELTIACACLAKTCMGLTDADVVTVEAYGPNKKALFSRSFTEDSLILEDLYTQGAEATEETQ